MPQWLVRIGPGRARRLCRRVSRVFLVSTIGLVCSSIAIWYLFVSTRGRRARRGTTLAERVGMDPLMGTPSTLVLAMLVVSVFLFVGWFVLGILAHRIETRYSSP